MKNLVFLFTTGAIIFILTGIHAQDVISLKNNKRIISPENKHDLTIGYKTGGQMYFMSPVLYKVKPSFCNTNQVYIRKHINEHIAIETGFEYYRTPMTNMASNIATDSRAPFKSHTCTISIPASVQYYLLPQKKIHPYIGLGAVYSISTNNYASSENDTKKCCLVNGTKYVSLLVTQGIIYEVNTKIQVSESVHFIPDNNNNIIGIDLGIGYKL